jgi:hypothetical protein
MAEIPRTDLLVACGSSKARHHPRSSPCGLLAQSMIDNHELRVRRDEGSYYAHLDRVPCTPYRVSNTPPKRNPRTDMPQVSRGKPVIPEGIVYELPRDIQ